MMPARSARRVSKRAASEAASLPQHYNSRDPRQARTVPSRTNTRDSSSSSSSIYSSTINSSRASSIHNNLLRRKHTTTNNDHSRHTSTKPALRIPRCRRLLWLYKLRNSNIPPASTLFLRRLINNSNSSSNTAHRSPIRTSPPASRASRASRAIHNTTIPCHPRLRAISAALIPIQLSTRSLALPSVHLCSHTRDSPRSSKSSIIAPPPAHLMLYNTRSTCLHNLLPHLCTRNLHIPPSRRKLMRRGRRSIILPTFRNATGALVSAQKQESCFRRARIAQIRRGPPERDILHTNLAPSIVAQSTRPSLP